VEGDDRVVVERRYVVVARQTELQAYDYRQPKAEGAADQTDNNVYYSDIYMIRIIQSVQHLFDNSSTSNWLP